MSPRFSPATDAGVLGVVPMPGDLPTRGRYLNVLYQYAIAGARAFRHGNIGPALIDVSRSLAEGRNYQGVDLSDPEDEWVYYSPMSWHPDSTRALWNEKTRLSAGEVRCRLRVARLLDAAPSAPVPAAKTPDAAEVPYALPLSAALTPPAVSFPLTVHGRSGIVVNRKAEDGFWETFYDHYSEDGETVYDGCIRVKTPDNMFQPGETTIVSRVDVTGAHTGHTHLRLVMKADARFQIFPDFSEDEYGQPKSRGFAEYDGVTRNVADMAP